MGTGSNSTAVASFRCGAATSAGRAPCTLSGRGFPPGKAITIGYAGTFDLGSKHPHYTNYVRHTRVDAHGSFTRPPIWLALTRCYMYGVDISPNGTFSGPALAVMQASAGTIHRNRCG